MIRRWIQLLAVLVAALTVSVLAHEKGGSDDTGPYEVVGDWLKPTQEGLVTYWSGVFAESPDRIFLISNGESQASQPHGRGTVPSIRNHFVVVVNAQGKLIEEWPQAMDLMVFPHSVQIDPYDPEKHVWIVDREGQQILKFTNDGKRVVLKLGEKGVAGSDNNHFNRPADLAFLPDGSFYVADGYGGSRVVKFDRNGTFLTQWGTKGTGPGQFNLVHSVAVGEKGRVFVADRTNNRVQIFDESGKYLDEWKGVSDPIRFHMTRDHFVWIPSGDMDRLLKYDLNGKLLTHWGTHGVLPGRFDLPHGSSVDSGGNVYFVDYWNRRVQKFRPRADADRSQLIGPPPIPAPRRSS